MEAATKVRKIQPQKQIFFPEYNAKGENKGIKIDHKAYIDLLFDMGYRRMDLERDFIFVKLHDGVLAEVTPVEIQDALISWVKDLPYQLQDGVTRDQLLEKIFKSPGVYFNPTKLSLLKPDVPLKINSDTKESAFFYFKNGFVKCSSEGYKLHPYSQLSNFIGKNQIIDRDFEILDRQGSTITGLGVFAQFCFNISFQEQRRFDALRSLIGYCLHGYFDTKLKAVNLTDSKVSELNEGRSGKSLLAKAIGKIRNSCDIPGKDFDPTKPFKYQQVDPTTQILHLNDVRRNFDFECLYNSITDGLVVERKSLQPFTVLVKILISSNRPLRVSGASSKDRVIEFELSDHYSEKYSPADEFGLWFFTDFDIAEWSRFDNFMMSCVSFYLIHGLIEIEPRNLNKRKLLQETGPEFVEFLTDSFENQTLIIDVEFEKHTVFESFLSEYPELRDHRLFRQLGYFSKCLKTWVQFTDGLLRLDERKTGKLRYATFISDKPENVF